MQVIDAVGIPEVSSRSMPILAAVKRLGAVYTNADAYIAKIRELGTVEPWTDHWETHYRYDLVVTRGGVCARTDRDAVAEDLRYGATQTPERMWPSLAADCLLVRSARRLGGGYVVREADRNRFVASAPGRSAVEIDANHYGVMTHADSATQILRFMS